MSDVKNWIVDYACKDPRMEGRIGSLKVTTEISKSGAFDYGNGKSGTLTVEGYPHTYDLRYCRENDLHMAMIESYFGENIVKVTEI